MLRCRSCQQRIDDKDISCPSCGTNQRSIIIETLDSTPAIAPVEFKKPVPRSPGVLGLALFAMLVVAGLLGLNSLGPDSPESLDAPQTSVPAARTTTVPTVVASRENVVDFPGIAPAPPSVARPVSLQTWAGAERLAIITRAGVRIVDLSSGDVESWGAPEPLLREIPAIVGPALIVVGATKAWARAPQDDGWREIAPADRVRKSSKPDRIWLRSLYEKELPTDADYIWNEVDLIGQSYRSMFRERELYFPTPELVSGLGGDIFRLTDAEINAWRLVSPNGVLIAVGQNDFVSKECSGRTFECHRKWYDAATGTQRDAIFNDLAENLEASYGAFLSVDGRFVVTESADERGGPSLTEIRSVASGTAVANICLWDEQLVWTSGSELFACVTEDGIEIYDTSTEASLGLVPNVDAATTAIGFLAAAE